MSLHLKPDVFEEPLARQGWVRFDALIPTDDLQPLRQAVLASVDQCGLRQTNSGATAAPDGTAHHAVGQYPALDTFLERRWLHDAITQYFGAPYILHAFNPVTVRPESTSYLHQIHRDVRTHAGAFRLMLNMLVMIDPFTLQNGATHVLSGSHHSPAAPAPQQFWPEAERLTGAAGSIVLFDSNLWHAAGRNQSSDVRVALTLSFSRAFIKQQMDYPRFLGVDYGKKASPEMRQLLGYNAMVPQSYAEFYQPASSRLYRADQG